MIKHSIIKEIMMLHCIKCQKSITFFVIVMLCVILFSPAARANDAAVTNCRTLVNAAERLACYDTIVLVSKQALPNVVTSAQNVPTPRANTATDFGLVAPVPAANTDKIESSIVGRFSGWQTNSRITLANGQVWQVIDDSRGICECDNPKVVVSRASFGTFFLEIAGKGNAPRVKRIK
jgi:hypothetical protein